MDKVTEKKIQLVVDQLVGDGENSTYSRIKSHLASQHPSLHPAPNVNDIFTCLVRILQNGPHLAADRISSDPSLKARASTIAKAANDGEHLLERHYAGEILNQVIQYPTSTLGGDSPQARVERLTEASKPFPYVDNYVKLVRAECKVLRACLHGDMRSIAVVGSGPVPLTGAMFAAHLGVQVTLVDNDLRATRDANNLIQHWEHYGALPIGAVCAVCDDARTVLFSRSNTNVGVLADCILVASLVPDDAKVALARRAHDSGWDGVLAVRSAHGLTALVNYQPASRADLKQVFDHVGYAVPAVCMENGRALGEDEEPVAVFPSDVLNSLDVYVPKSTGSRNARRARRNIMVSHTQTCAMNLGESKSVFAPVQFSLLLQHALPRNITRLHISSKLH